MMAMDHSVRVSTSLTWGHNFRVQFPAEWVWVANNPAMIRLVIGASHSVPVPRPTDNEDGQLSRRSATAEWAMSRDSLREALLGVRGVGAVRMAVHPQRTTTLCVALLTAGRGWFEATTSSKAAASFLAVTYGHVSLLRESLIIQEAANRLDPSTFLETE